jgi:hypothetical protein
MKLAFSVFIFLLGGMHSVAQSKRGNVWVTGTSGNTIDFNAQNIISKTGIYFPFKYFDSGSSSICDTNGNLILASDGMNIYDSYGNYIQEGDITIRKKMVSVCIHKAVYFYPSIVISSTL